MNKYFYPIFKSKFKSWIKYYLYNKSKEYVIPPEYKKVEYIEGNNSGYVTTDIYLEGSDTVKMTFRTLATGTTTCCLFGSYKSGETNNFSLYSAGATYHAYWRYAGSLYQNHKFQLDTLYNIEFDWHTIKVNDDTYTTTFTESEFTTGTPIYVGHINASGSPKIKGRIYSFEVVGKHKLVPVVKIETGDVGLYDKKTGVFYPAERNYDRYRRIRGIKSSYFY